MSLHNPHSPHVAALRGIVTAARNYENGTGLVDAVAIHTARLDHGQLVALIGLLAGVLSMTLDDLARYCESAANLDQDIVASMDEGGGPAA
ncbi:hypothetical protein [Nocardia amamiensis]|uniref:hypothetical protein n=1 Tax=Nocardia amamiensis TaxID=404578 RepID=UPI0034115C33